MPDKAGMALESLRSALQSCLPLHRARAKCWSCCTSMPASGLWRLMRA